MKKAKEMKKKIEIPTEAKVKVVRGFALSLQGYYHVGEEVTLHFGRIQKVGILMPEQYKDLLRKGNIEVIDLSADRQEEEVSDGGI